MKRKRLPMRSGNLTRQKNLFVIGFLTPTLVMFCIFYLYPLLTVFFTSFCKWDYTNITNPEFFGWDALMDNYNYLFTTYPYFWEALRNSLIWALLGVFVQIPISTLMALAFSRKMRGVKVIRNIYIVPCMISSAAMGLIFLQLYSPLYGIVNPVVSLFTGSDFGDNILLRQGWAFVALTCAYIFFTGTTTLMILGNIMAIPTEIREAACLDGANGLRQDLHITVPLIRGTLKTVSVLASTSGFLLYNEVHFLTKGAAGTYSISYIIRELAITSPRTQFGRANAVAVVQILGGMLIVLFVNIVYSLPEKIEKIRSGGKR